MNIRPTPECVEASIKRLVRDAANAEIAHIENDLRSLGITEPDRSVAIIYQRPPLDPHYPDSLYRGIYHAQDGWLIDHYPTWPRPKRPEDGERIWMTLEGDTDG